MKRAFLSFIIFVLLQFVVSAFMQVVFHFFAGGTMTDVLSALNVLSMSGSEMSVTLAVTNLVILAVFLRLRWVVLSLEWLKSHSRSVLFWSAVAALGSFSPSICMQEMLPGMDEMLEETFIGMLHTPHGFMTLCFLVPFVEEVVFRGAMAGGMLSSGCNRWVAIVTSAAVFGLVHGNLAQMPHAMAVGVLLGWMYVRSGSIVPGVVFHCINNTVACVTELLVDDSSSSLGAMVGDAVVIPLIIVSVLVFLIAIYMLNRKLNTAIFKPETLK